MTASLQPGRPRVLVSQPVDEAALAELSQVARVSRWPGPYPIPPRELPAALDGCTGYLSILTDPVDAAVLGASPTLRVVAQMAVGYDNIDVAAATRRGILVTNTPDVLTEATAEFTWTLILALTRGLVTARETLLAGGWTHWAPDGFLGRELAGKTLGIVGLGRIGNAVARRAPAFGVDVVALRRGTGAGAILRLMPDEFLARADIISLHCPLTAETRHFADRAFFAAMKPGSFFVNTARGGLVDEAALLEAVESGHLAGAALDVYAGEPVDGRHPLVRHPRVLATPHMASATLETRTAMAERAAENLAAALTGRRPQDLVNPEAFPGRVRGISK